jgi:hypothetical protein
VETVVNPAIYDRVNLVRATIAVRRRGCIDASDRFCFAVQLLIGTFRRCSWSEVVRVTLGDPRGIAWAHRGADRFGAFSRATDFES